MPPGLLRSARVVVTKSQRTLVFRAPNFRRRGGSLPWSLPCAPPRPAERLSWAILQQGFPSRIPPCHAPNVKGPHMGSCLKHRPVGASRCRVFGSTVPVGERRLLRLSGRFLGLFLALPTLPRGLPCQNTQKYSAASGTVLKAAPHMGHPSTGLSFADPPLPRS